MPPSSLCVTKVNHVPRAMELVVKEDQNSVGARGGHSTFLVHSHEEFWLDAEAVVGFLK